LQEDDLVAWWQKLTKDTGQNIMITNY